MINKNFYPTPEKLIYKMVFLENIKTILEPSAGKGDIVDFIKKRNEKLDIDCIENDEMLQNILKGKKHKLIHDDFLTFETNKKYELIIANPPFDEGDKHLKKMIELQERTGGKIVCLLNAETLKNDYSNLRKELKQKLEKYNAEIEYLQGEFEEAERKTSVEVALIKVEIPEKNVDSLILENLKKEVINEDIFENTEIVENNFLNQIISRYKFEEKAGLQLIKEWKKLEPFIKDKINPKKEDYCKSIINLEIEGASKYSDNWNNSYIEQLRLKYWKTLFENNEFIRNFTSNIRSDLFAKIESLKDYEFSLFNIEQIKNDINKNLEVGIEKTILDLFEKCTQEYSYYPECKKNIHYYNGWCTNKAHKINKKIILPINGFSRYYDDGRLETYRLSPELFDMEKVFNYLDASKTTSNISFLLERANQEKNYKIELKYFNLTFYKKGTCHIEFTNLDLLEKFNIFGSQRKKWLPPNYGKTKYEDMNKQDQDTINEFQGKEKYNEVINNKDKFIIENNRLFL